MHLLLSSFLLLNILFSIHFLFAKKVKEKLPQITNIDLLQVPIAKSSKVVLNGQELKIEYSYGSGLFADPNDFNDNIFYAITDRGPSLSCQEIKQLTKKKFCKSNSIRVFLLPNFVPTIYKLQISKKDKISIISKIPLKNQKELPINGLPLLWLNKKVSQKAINLSKKSIFSFNGIDPEAIVKTKTGNFWIAEEDGSSLVKVSKNGTILKRFIPINSKKSFKKSQYPIKEALPAIINKRTINQGISALALNHKENLLFFTFKRPLNNNKLDITSQALRFYALISSKKK